MLSMCVWMVWVVLSSRHVSMCLQDYVCFFCSFTHLATFLKLKQPDSPLTTKPSPHRRLDPLSPRTAQKPQASHFKLRCSQANQSTFMLVNQRVWPDSHPRTDSHKKLCRQARQTPSTIPVSLRKLCSFFQPALPIVDQLLTKKIAQFFQPSLRIVDRLLTKKIAQFSWASSLLPNNPPSSETGQRWPVDQPPSTSAIFPTSISR